jgi:hypothetical protein
VCAAVPSEAKVLVDSGIPASMRIDPLQFIHRWAADGARVACARAV